MQQLALALAPPPEPAFESFFPARNSGALHALQAALDGGERFIYLWGPRGAGKSHLLRAFAGEAAARGSAARYFRGGQPIEGLMAGKGHADADAVVFTAVDDVDRLDMVGQLALFDLFNRLRAGTGALLTAGARPPVDLPLREDLRTRIGSGVVLRLEPLTDEEKAAAISEHGRRRGLDLAPELIEYLLSHVTRDMGTQMAVVDTLDRVSLERKRPLTLPLLRDVLRLLETGPPA